MDRKVFGHRRLGLMLVLALAAGAGCQTVRTPEAKIAKSGIPREFTKVSMPPHVVEPPDLIVVEVLEALPGRPISGERLVRPDGTISLGFYGDVYVAGLTLEQVKEKVILHLREFLTDEGLGLVRVNEETGEFEEVPISKNDRVAVDVTAYNSKYYYVEGDVGSPGRLPITGNETVLDAIVNSGGLLTSAANQNIRLVRPAPPGACCQQLLPVNLAAIINAGDPTTNYQIMPGDRIVVYRDPIVRTTIFMERLSQPFSLVLQNILQYSFTKRTLDFLSTGADAGGGVANPGIVVGPGAR